MLVPTTQRLNGRAVAIPLFISCLFAAGCPSKDKASDPAPRAAAQPAKQAASAEPEPQPIQDKAPPSPEARRLPDEALKSTVPPPSWKTIHRLLRAKSSAITRSYADPKALGEGRFAAVVSAVRGKTIFPNLKLVLLEREGETWRLSLHDLLDYAKEETPFADACPGGLKVLVSLYVSDYDWDGAPEIKVRHRFKGCEGDEEEPEIATPSTNFQIFNAGPPLTEALSALVFYGKGEGHHSARETKVIHGKDLNGDGHPDLTIRFHEQDFACQLGETYHENRVWTYHWEAATDSFKLVTDDKSSRVESGSEEEP